MSRVLVVGGNRGLGLELVRSLVSQGKTVFVTTRSHSEDLERAKPFKIITDIELQDDLVGQRVLEGLGDQNIDIAIINAGYFTTETFEQLNIAEQRKMYEICALAPLRICQALVLGGKLGQGSKIALITSEGGSIGLRTEKEGGANYVWKFFVDVLFENFYRVII
jgi:short-subunit dehydrogenase